MYAGIKVNDVTNSAVDKRFVDGNIVLHIGEALFLSGTTGDDEADGETAATAVKTFAEACKRIEANPKIDTVIVVGTVTVDDNQAWSLPKGASLVRGSDFTSALVSIKNGGSLELSDITIDGKLISAAAPLISVDAGGTLSIAGGTELKRNVNHASNLRFGGAVGAHGTVNMNGGTISENEATHGGGVSMYGTSATFNFTGGIITRNAATNSASGKSDGVGGGVNLAAGAVMNMGAAKTQETAQPAAKRARVAKTPAAASETPSITNNTASRSGGGIAVGSFYGLASATPTKLVMNSGVIDSNTAIFTGGGIFIQDSCEGYIYAGDITNNKAHGSASHFAGGGIYVNGLHATAAWTPHVYNSEFAKNEQGFVHGYLYLANAEITNNTADWNGGAIGGCITSQDVVGDGATAIYDNTSNNTGPTWSKYSGEGNVEVFHSVKSYWEDAFMNRAPHAPGYLSQYMIGGGEYNWSSPSSGEPISTDVLYNNTTVMSAATAATAGSAEIEAARAGATVHIANNYSASCGGGIGTNGVVEIGTVSPKVDVTVQKAWNEEAADENAVDQRPTTLKFKLFRAAGAEAEKELVDEVVVAAGEDGTFAYAWKDLIKHVVGSNESVEYIYTVEEDLDYATTTADGKEIKVGDYYKATAVRGDDTAHEVNVPTSGEAYDVVEQAIQNWVITNTYTVPEEPEEPETPPEFEEPETPNNPPETPEEPETPDTPVTPETPNTPNTPKTDNPSTPNTPTGKSTISGEVKTSDNAPILPIAVVAVLALGAVGLSAYRRRHEDQ